MNPRQRRGAVLMILASIGAIAVFFAVLGYVSSVRAEVGDFRTVLQLTQDVPANVSITASMVRKREVPKKWLSGSFLTDASELDGKVAVRSLGKGEYLNQGMIADAPKLQTGQREIAIMIDAETGVAGKVKPGSLVDVYATFAGTGQNQQSCAKRVLANVRVVDVGLVRSQKQTESNGQVDVGQVVPITFALSPTDSLTLTYAESYADKVRLALVGPGTTSIPPRVEVCSSNVNGGR